MDGSVAGVPGVPGVPAVSAVAGGVPLDRRPLVPVGAGVRHWYEDALGWPTAPGLPVRLRTGVRFDVLDVPQEAGRAALERLEGPGCPGRRFPVAVGDGRMRLLVAAGSAEELPGLLDWLEWGGLGLDLTAIGAGGSMEAPCAVASAVGRSGGGTCPDGARRGGTCPRGACGPGGGDCRSARSGVRPVPPGRDGGSQGAAVWLRPPEPGREVEASLPTLSAMGTRSAPGGGESPPDLVRLVNTVATQVHRVRLRRACAATRADGQPLAFS
ncbi:SCO3374 family protein [Streptomyces sp. NPDC014986]|uniref:SCO3374 family protein n=1 Tax=Streptomyces sp. NPDC014986 TaxID=3364934 RepID=UPI00370076B3